MGTDAARPFRYCDVQLWQHIRRLDLPVATDTELLSASFSALTYTNQKNCVPGEVIGLGRSGHSYACGTLALARRIKYLRSHNAPPTTPLCAYRHADSWCVITNSHMTNVLRAAAYVRAPDLGIDPADVVVKAFRATGAMAMLCGGVDTLISRIRGRWLSDAMHRYLTAQAQPLIADVASRMLTGGNFTIVPGQNVPDLHAVIQDPTPAAPVPTAPTEPPSEATIAAWAATVAAAQPLTA